MPSSGPVRWALIGMGVAAMAGSPLAIGAALGKGKNSVRVPVAAGARNPVRGVLLSSTRIIARTSDEAVKVSNSGPSGGAGLFSCASIAGGSASNREPCLEAENRASGSAFEFMFKGPIGGLFQVGSDIDKQFPAVRPFVTNATGVATGLNADRVDGLHAQDIIDTAVERSSVQVGAQGPQGPQGAQGTRGPQGVQGDAGPPGTPLVANASTAPNATYSLRPVVLLPAEGLNSTKPAVAADGVDLLNGTPLVLDPGTYIVQTTVHAYEEASTSNLARYALAGLFLDGALQATLTTSDVPGDVHTPAQASEATVITVAGGASGVIKLRGMLHSKAGTPSDSVVTAGATLVVTEVNPLTP